MTALLWDITHSAGVVLSLGGTKATVDNNGAVGGQNGIRGNIAHSAGIYKLEYDIVLWDGIAVGATSASGVKAPGFAAKGVGYDDGGYYFDNGGGTGHNPGNSTAMVASIRILEIVDLDNHEITLISIAAPQGTNLPVSLPNTGEDWYPSVGTGYTNGAAHPCSCILYGYEADMIIPYVGPALPWAGDPPTYSAFLGLM